MTFLTKPAEEAFDRSAYPEDAIFFFDFDGVLATQCEEKIYRMAEQPGERRMLEERAQFANVDHRLYPDTGYLRHLVYQGYAWTTQIDQHHEAVAFAEELNDSDDPFFVITARSGYWAVKRMMEFFEDNHLYPQETFCLGRSSKAQLLSELRGDWPERPFVFFEDNQKHIDACVALQDPLLTIVRVDWDTCTANAEYLLSEALRPLSTDHTPLTFDIESYDFEVGPPKIFHGVSMTEEMSMVGRSAVKDILQNYLPNDLFKQRYATGKSIGQLRQDHAKNAVRRAVSKIANIEDVRHVLNFMIEQGIT